MRYDHCDALFHVVNVQRNGNQNRNSRLGCIPRRNPAVPESESDVDWGCQLYEVDDPASFNCRQQRTEGQH